MSNPLESPKLKTKGAGSPESLKRIEATPPNLLWYTNTKKLPKADSDCIRLLSDPCYFSERMDMASTFDGSFESSQIKRKIVESSKARKETSKRHGSTSRTQRRRSTTGRRSSTSATLHSSLNWSWDIENVSGIPRSSLRMPDHQEPMGGSAAAAPISAGRGRDDNQNAETRRARRRHTLSVISNATSQRNGKSRQGRDRRSDTSTVGASSASSMMTTSRSSRSSAESRQRRMERKAKQKNNPDRKVSDTTFWKGISIKRDRLDFDERLTKINDPKLLETVEEALESIKCPICYEFYNPLSPKQDHIPCLLGCGHSFCVSHSPRVSECPICRAHIGGNCHNNRKARGRMLPKSPALCEAAKSIISVVATTLDLAEEKEQQERIKAMKKTYSAENEKNQK